MAIKKSALYSSIWSSCDELRGGMDASQYKDYVLVLLFMKYVSDKHAAQKNALVEVPSGASYDDILALKGDKEIGDKINKIIARLAEANNLKGVIDQADFNDDGKLGRGKEMVDRLSNLVAVFDKPELDFRGNRAEDDDLLGDAYEYLMKNFATESGKSKGQFYTPAEVSRVMAQVIGVGEATSGGQTIVTRGSWPALSMAGLVFAMVTTVVTPPRAAARLPLAMVSLDSAPGSRKWQWMSTNPGHTMHPAASRVSSPFRPRPIFTTRPPSTSRSRGSEVSSAGLMKCPLMMAMLINAVLPENRAPPERDPGRCRLRRPGRRRCSPARA